MLNLIGNKLCRIPAIKSLVTTITFTVKPIFRTFTTSTVSYGKRNFRKFTLPNKRGFKAFKSSQLRLGLVDHRGVRPPGYTTPGMKIGFIKCPEMTPELIVPDLKDFKLKPYVSYRSDNIVQSEFTASDLFDSVYAKKMIADFKAGKLDEQGNPLEPSEDELLTAEEAKIRARIPGSDIF